MSSQSGVGAISAAGVAAVSPDSSGAPAPGTPEELEYFKEIHEKFIEMKKKLGEPTENLSFDRFKGTLEKNRDALIARYQCRAVAFKVYDKEGKASLKAIPVRS